MDYAILEISGRQYMIKPGQTVEVDRLSGVDKKLTVDKVLLTVENGKVEIGQPYLKKSLDVEVLGEINKPKIRVSTYKAKSNYRRVRGQKRTMTQIKLIEKGDKS